MCTGVRNASAAVHRDGLCHGRIQILPRRVYVAGPQVFVTPRLLCIVMDYATGGELFGYLRKSVRLQEDHARYFFQQLVRIANAHSRWYLPQPQMPCAQSSQHVRSLFPLVSCWCSAQLNVSAMLQLAQPAGPMMSQAMGRATFAVARSPEAVSRSSYQCALSCHRDQQSSGWPGRSLRKV